MKRPAKKGKRTGRCCFPGDPVPLMALLFGKWQKFIILKRLYPKKYVILRYTNPKILYNKNAIIEDNEKNL